MGQASQLLDHTDARPLHLDRLRERGDTEAIWVNSYDFISPIAGSRSDESTRQRRLPGSRQRKQQNRLAVIDDSAAMEVKRPRAVETALNLSTDDSSPILVAIRISGCEPTPADSLHTAMRIQLRCRAGERICRTPPHDRSHPRGLSSDNDNATVAPCVEHWFDFCSCGSRRNFVQRGARFNSLSNGARLVEHCPKHLARRGEFQRLGHLRGQRHHTIEQSALQCRGRPLNEGIDSKTLNHGARIARDCRRAPMTDR